MPAEVIVQVYASFPGKLVDRPKKLLNDFLRVSLAPNQTKTVRYEITLRDLKCRDSATHSWNLEPVRHAFRLFDALSKPTRQKPRLSRVALQPLAEIRMRQPNQRLRAFSHRLALQIDDPILSNDIHHI